MSLWIFLQRRPEEEEERKEYSKFSLDSARQGMGNNRTLYSLEDLREKFS